MKIQALKTKLCKEGDDIVTFIRSSIPHLAEGSVLVITSKIVSLAEGRVADPKARNELIKSGSDAAFKTKYVWLTLTDNVLMANAGIDDSNGNGKLVLLPKNSMRTARTLWSTLKKHYGVRNLGIVISDSNPVPLRAGVVGIALGYAGIRATLNYRGKPDLFGRTFKFAQANIVDSIAAAGNLVMGEGAEQMPLALITGAPVQFTNRTTKISIPLKDDMYAPLLKQFLKKKRRH